MNKSHEDENHLSVRDDKVPCVVCRELIQRGAKVCIHCDQAQDWTRYLMRWTKVAGGLLLVVSLISAAHSLRELIPNPAKFIMRPVACESDSLKIALTNIGEIPAIVEHVSLNFRVDGHYDAKKDLLLSAINGFDNEIIAPNETKMIEYVRKVSGVRASFSVPSVGINTCVYVVSVQTVDVKGNEQVIKGECACPSE